MMLRNKKIRRHRKEKTFKKENWKHGGLASGAGPVVAYDDVVCFSDLINSSATSEDCKTDYSERVGCGDAHCTPLPMK